MKSVSRGFNSRLGRLIFPVFVLLSFPYRHIRVSLSDNEPVNRISSEVWRLTLSVIELFRALFSVIEKRVLWHHVGFRYLQNYSIKLNVKKL